MAVHPPLLRLPARRTTGSGRAALAHRRTPRTRAGTVPGPACVPDDRRDQPYDITEADPEGRRRGRVLRTAAGLCPEHRHRLHSPRRAPPIGVVANQPMVLAGCLDIDVLASKAGAFRAFLRLRSTSRMLHPGRRAGLSCRERPRNTAASSRTAPSCSMPMPSATVPKVTLITRKAYGGAYDVMASKHLRGDRQLSPGRAAEIAVMGAKGAVEIIFRKEKLNDEAAGSRRSTDEYRRQVRQPVRGREPRLHRRCDPRRSETRARICRSPSPCCGTKSARRTPGSKHGNIPL